MTLKPIFPLRRPTPFKKICKLVSRAIREYDMIFKGDRILVGISGGADSMVLMHVLRHLQKRSPFPFELHAVTIHMQFTTMDVPALVSYCKEAGWPHEVVEFDGAGILRKKGVEDSPCSLCSRLRRGSMHGEADRLNCNKLCLGQHLDDLCVSMLMSLFRGGGVKTMGAHVPADNGTKRLIRPLCFVPKSLITEAAEDFGFPKIKSCPFEEKLKRDGDRAYLERLVEQLDSRFRDIRQCMLTSMKNLEPIHLLDTAFLPDYERLGDTEVDRGDGMGPDGQ